MKTLLTMLCFCLLYPAQAQKTDTILGITCDSFKVDLGDVPAKNTSLKIHFRYVNEEPAIIEKAWTGDPHYICSYPREPLFKGKEYSFTVCFHFNGCEGVFRKEMGFLLHNGERVSFVFKGNICPLK